MKCRLHDLRHSVQDSANRGIPEAVALDMMGHMSAAMLRRYTHIGAQARRDAIETMHQRWESERVSKDLTKVTDPKRTESPLTH